MEAMIGRLINQKALHDRQAQMIKEGGLSPIERTIAQSAGQLIRRQPQRFKARALRKDKIAAHLGFARKLR